MEKHRCEIPEGAKGKFYGQAISHCKEDDDGRFWAYCDTEYCTQVNFCPFCGKEAPVAISPGKREDDSAGISSVAEISP